LAVPDINTTPDHLSKQLFEQLFREEFIPLTGLARGYVYNQDTAKEIVQEVFINLWLKRDSISTEKSITSYLFTSVRNRCLNYLRDHKNSLLVTIHRTVTNAKRLLTHKPIQKDVGEGSLTMKSLQEIKPVWISPGSRINHLLTSTTCPKRTL
jgi:RNA polymerase sigma factor (sigma-70 family)